MNIRLKLFLVAAVLAAVGSKLSAQNQGNFDSLQVRKMSLEMIDQTNREAMQREEVAKQRATRLAPATYDLDRDGTLDAKEYAAWEGQVRAETSRIPALVKLIDLNGDKAIDDAEWAAGRSKLIK